MVSRLRRFPKTLVTLGDVIELPDGYTLFSSLGITPGDDVVISSGVKILFDVNMADSARIGFLTISSGGEWKVDPTRNTRLLAKGISTSGSYLAGTLAEPLTFDHTVDLYGSRPTVSGNAGGGALVTGLTHTPGTEVATGNNGTTNDYGGVNRGFLVNPGGTLGLYGSQAPAVTRMNAGYISGTTITVADFVTAPAGSTVLVSPDSFYNVSKRTEIRTLAVDAVNTKTLTLNSALGFSRWGQLQYMTDTGMSVTPGTFSLKTASNPGGMRTHVDQDPVIDERAFVVILKPTIKLRGYDYGSTDLATHGFGMHGMSMGLTSNTVLKNVGFEDYGQRGLLGRYAWHWHIPSYNADGTNKTDGAAGTNKYVVDTALLDGCTGLRGHNRFVSIHAAKGVKITKCIAHDSNGHAFFEEDGSEQENEISYCISIAHRDPGVGNRLKEHDAQVVGFWFANPFNTHLENWGVDSVGGPWWNAHSNGLSTKPSIQHGCVGFSALVPINPGYGKLGVFNGNSGLSCAGQAGSDSRPTTNSGSFNNRSLKIRCTTAGVAYASFNNPATDVDLLLSNVRLYKCGGYLNQVHKPNYLNWRIADNNLGPAISGVTDFGASNNIILVRETLNHESNYLAAIRTSGFISYHGTLAATNVTADGYIGNVFTTNMGNNGAAVEKICVQETWESYTGPIHDYPIQNSGWALRNCDAIFQTPPLHLTRVVNTYDAITGTSPTGPKYQDSGARTVRNTEGILFDRYGFLGTGPSQAGMPNSHIVFNQPYFTTGLTVTPLQNNPQSCWTTTPFMGMTLPNNGSTRARAAHRYQRVTSSLVDIAGAIWEQGAFAAGDFLLPFMSGACPIGGFVRWTWPGLAAPTTSFSGSVHCAGTGNQWISANPYLNNATDVTYWGIEWGGATASFTCAGQVYNNSGVTSIATLIASSGYKFWHDTVNGFVWIKLRVHPSAYGWTLAP